MSGRTALCILVLHAAVSLVFAFTAGKPLRQLNNIAYLVIMSANACVAVPASTVAIAIAMHCQSNAASTSNRRIISHTTLVTRCVVFLALAALWPFRLTLSRNVSRGKGIWWSLTECYPYVGWAGVNSGLLAIGSYLTLYNNAAFEQSSYIR